MSSYEDRMAEKYNFLKKAESENNVQKEEVSSEDKITNDVVPDENQEKDSLLVPLDAWNTVLNQLGNLHESSQLMAEARERAAKAEAEELLGISEGIRDVGTGVIEMISDFDDLDLVVE